MKRSRWPKTLEGDRLAEAEEGVGGKNAMSLQLFKIAELRGCWGSVAWTVGQRGSTRVLFCNSFLWYRSAIVQVAV